MTARHSFFLAAAVVAGLGVPAAEQTPDAYKSLVAIHEEFVKLRQPRVTVGVPDYTQAAIDAQRSGLDALQKRLGAINSSSWPVSQRVDYHLVRAELNGLDFDHRVIRPWSTNPAFYVTVFPSRSDQPLREGPHAEGAVEVWSYTFPLTPERARQMSTLVEPEPWLVAPDFVYRTVADESGSLKDHRGSEIVMLVLFSLPESRTRLFELERASTQLSNKKLKVLAHRVRH